MHHSFLLCATWNGPHLLSHCLPLTAELLNKRVAKKQRFVTAIALVCFGVVLLIGHCVHGISQPASPVIPPEKIFQQTLRDTMKDNILSVNITLLFFSFFHLKPSITASNDSASKWVMKLKATRGVVYQGLCTLQSITPSIAAQRDELDDILQRSESHLFLFHMDWFWINYAQKHALLNSFTIMRPLHIIIWTLLQKHIWKTIVLCACTCKCAFVHAFECQMRDFSMKHRWAQHFYCLSVCGACVCVCDLLSHGIYAKPAVFSYAPSYRCLSSTWPGLAPVLPCIVTPGYSNTQSHHLPIPMLKQANAFFLSDCFAVAAHWRKWKEGWQSTVQIWMDISQAELVHVEIAQHCVLYLNYTPTKKKLEKYWMRHWILIFKSKKIIDVCKPVCCLLVENHKFDLVEKRFSSCICGFFESL